MSQLSAYELLEQYQQTCGFITVKSPVLQEVYIHQPIQKDQDARATFIQFYNKDEVQTEIGTMSVPTAFELNRHINILEQIFGDSDATLYQVKHCQNTVNVSYSCELRAYIISAQGSTIICQDDLQIEAQSQPNTQRVCEVAQYFFQLLKRMHPKLRQCLAQDLTNRTLVGVSCFKQLYWFGLVEHYDPQKIMHYTIVRDFLTHYNFEFVKVRKREKVKFADLKNLYDEVYNSYIDNFNDMNRESTFYIWKDSKFIGSFCIPHKHYLVIQAFKQQWRNKVHNPYAYLNDFKLSLKDIQFYQLYTDLMMNQNRDQITFSTQTSVVFNCILLRKSLTEKQSFRYSLSHCINPTVVVLIPIGLNRGGFEQLFDGLNQPFTRIIKSCENLTIDCQICCLNHFSPPSRFDEIQKICKSYNFRVITIGLYHDSMNYKGNCKLPFSLPYLASCLSTHTNESLIEAITYIKKFQNLDFKKLPFNYTLPCILFPRDQEIYLSQNEKLMQDLENVILGKEDQITYLKDLGNLYSSINIHYFREEALQLLQLIEQTTGIELNRIGWPQPRQSKEMLIFIDKSNWENIEDHTCDCIEIILRKFQKDTQINEMFLQIKGQFYENRERLYKRNTQNIRMNGEQKQSFETQVRIAIVVIDGIIIYIPEGFNSKEGIPIFTKKLDLSAAEIIVEQVSMTIAKFQSPIIAEKSVVLQQITINNIQWPAYIVKLYPLKIKLEVKRI